ncbi:hypothetical protein HBI56_193600 [Parastagonospora nodorum]|uniref:Uncharacterized protein n=2 Tax=Phaeosphaeria nodorum (strain SN15 / ATCC MYA-4574 / FGSC 10173) TaxID=321614 RepID=A0A7U2EZI2_PHANO|nr:hypothetical protein SNOG_14937 [Parastagonospora nodorum SN15]KAH3906213.1 hypothetical protein HBH56_205240 [Parastagonospora nodorum]EAT77789.1 hypothetical protein SNOG_14937 [Parastagonospora nodorum SN15]KAH3923826.1 hypothetical protein HBH54_204110 [Parastagonospora nodorum]KAH3942272.1 hypothetical protein HBH53_190210 [Parastagonospora nodorum]KAH3962334.1 hypothetical protein HBH51_175410 [Parastagonospora nodorum]
MEKLVGKKPLPEKVYRESIIQELQDGPKTFPGLWGRQTILREQLLVWVPTCMFWLILQWDEKLLPPRSHTVPGTAPQDFRTRSSAG